MYLVTGSTGFLGKQLVSNLLGRKGTIYCLIWESERDLFEEWKKRLGEFSSRIVPFFGDVTKPFCGLSDDDIEELKQSVQHFFHMVSLYDISSKEDECYKINVQGTHNAVNLANRLGSTFHFISSMAVGLNYQGTFSENMLDEGQEVSFPFARTKLEAEQLLHEKIQVPFRIYRPGILVGSSETGETSKIEGPYFAFKIIQLMSQNLPKWYPLLGGDWGRWHLVPVNYVAKSILHIAHKEGLDGKTFHIGDKEPMKVLDILNEFCRVAHAPQFSPLGEATVVRTFTNKVLKQAKRLPMAGFLRQQVLDLSGIPEKSLDLLTWDMDVDQTESTKALSDSGLSCPPLRQYAGLIWNYWEFHLDPILSKSQKSTLMAKALKETPSVVVGRNSVSQLVEKQINRMTKSRIENLAEVIQGKTILLTGGSSGIGLAMAHRLARANGKVILVARTLEKLKVAQSEVEQLGGVAFVETCDLSSPDACKELIDKVVAEHGGVDILINNAGRSIRRPIHHSYDRFHDFKRTMELNYFGCIQLILGVLPGMRERKYGHVINISSIGCQTNVPRFSAYVASKSALDAFSRTMNTETLHDNVVFTNVYMPLVRTPMIGPTKMYDHLPVLSPDQAAKKALTPLITRQRLVGTPTGNIIETLHAISPAMHNALLNFGFRMFPDGAPKGVEEDKLSPESIAFAYLSRGMHW